MLQMEQHNTDDASLTVHTGYVQSRITLIVTENKSALYQCAEGEIIA